MIIPFPENRRPPDAPARASDPFNPRGLTFADLDEVARLEILAIPERLQRFAAVAHDPETLIDSI